MARLVRDYDYDVISHELRHAADTIWELRCKCSDLMGEREELSSRLEHATEMNSMLIGMPEHDRKAIASTLTTIDGINLSERIRELEAENEKLREYAKAYLAAVRLGCDICPYCDPDLCDAETEPMREGCRLWEEMRELGVEVK